jgi:hypothetical protein
MAGQRLDLGEVNQDRSASATATASRPRATGATSWAGADSAPVPTFPHGGRDRP